MNPRHLLTITLLLHMTSPANGGGFALLEEPAFVATLEGEPANYRITAVIFDDMPGDHLVFDLAGAANARPEDFLPDPEGPLLEMQIRLKNWNLGGLPGGPIALPIVAVSVELLDVNGEPGNVNDQFYFGSPIGFESTGYFPDSPVFSGSPPETLTWSGGFLPPNEPATESVLNFTLHLDPAENFDVDADLVYFRYRLHTVTAIPEPSCAGLLVLAGVALGTRRCLAFLPLLPRKEVRFAAQ